MDNNALNQTPATPAPAPAPAPEAQPAPSAPAPQPVLGQTPADQAPATPVIPAQKSKAPVVIIIIILVLLLIGGVIAAIFILGPMLRNNKYIESAEQLTQKISSVNGESIIFFDSDLEKIDAELFKNPDGEKFGPESYATYYDQKAIICLNDGEKRVDNISGTMEVKDVATAGKCNFSVDDRDKIKYLNNYYAKKYNLEVRDKDTKKVNDHFVVFTNKGAIDAEIEIKDKTITITDDYEKVAEGYTNINDIHELINNYIEDTQKDLGEDDDRIIEARLYNKEYFILQSTLKAKDAEKFAQGLAEYLENKNVKHLELYIASYSYEIVEGQYQVVIDYKVTIMMANGLTDIKLEEAEE